MTWSLTMLTVDLLLRDDDLAGGGIVGVRDGVVQDADSANNSPSNLRFSLSFDVGWVADD